jgi:hypothetical protein
VLPELIAAVLNLFCAPLCDFLRADAPGEADSHLIIWNGKISFWCITIMNDAGTATTMTPRA